MSESLSLSRLSAVAMLVLSLVLGLPKGGTGGAPEPPGDQSFFGPALIGTLTFTPDGSQTAFAFVGNCGPKKAVTAVGPVPVPFADVSEEGLRFSRISNGTDWPELESCYRRLGDLVIIAVTRFIKGTAAASAEVVLLGSVPHP
jgi:hypothetical protein